MLWTMVRAVRGAVASSGTAIPIPQHPLFAPFPQGIRKTIKLYPLVLATVVHTQAVQREAGEFACALQAILNLRCPRNGKRWLALLPSTAAFLPLNTLNKCLGRRALCHR